MDEIEQKNHGTERGISRKTIRQGEERLRVGTAYLFAIFRSADPRT